MNGKCICKSCICGLHTCNGKNGSSIANNDLKEDGDKQLNERKQFNGASTYKVSYTHKEGQKYTTIPKKHVEEEYRMIEKIKKRREIFKMEKLSTTKLSYQNPSKIISKDIKCPMTRCFHNGIKKGKNIDGHIFIDKK